MTTYRKIVFSLMLSGLFLLPAGSAMAGDELIVSAAASLTNVLQELGGEFTQANPGTKLTFNFGASGSLLQQMKNGAPVDIFASASQKDMDKAGELGLLDPASRRNFTANRLVLAAPLGGNANLKTLADLTDPAIGRIGLGNGETVPAGRYAKVVLTGAGLWEKLTAKFIFGDSVRQVLDYLSRGEVDAGVVYASDALQKRDAVKIVAELPVPGGIIYPAARLKESHNPDGADRFLEFLLSPKAQAMLVRYGFEPPIK
ncbi:MAG: molybdate ABC transporter substrate-binding protein [Desulfobulbaceae bacterium]|nr:molybdate ABC transporter substrate-binding protein [Desulfobulbaceae bacterium]